MQDVRISVNAKVDKGRSEDEGIRQRFGTANSKAVDAALLPFRKNHRSRKESSKD